MQSRAHTLTQAYAPDNCPSNPYKAVAVQLVFFFNSLLFEYATTGGGRKIVYTSSLPRPLKMNREEEKPFFYPFCCSLSYNRHA